jgi:hypothetical protein
MGDGTPNPIGTRCHALSSSRGSAFTSVKTALFIVALFLPVQSNKDRQRAAKAGTRRNRKSA